MKDDSLKFKTPPRIYLSNGNVAYTSEDGLTKVKVTFRNRGKIQVVAFVIFLSVFGLSSNLAINFKFYGRMVVYSYLLLDLWLLHRKTEIFQDTEVDLPEYLSFSWFTRIRHAAIGGINLFAFLLSFSD